MNFQDFSTGYFYAYSFTTKKDSMYIVSDNHLPEIEAPKTAKAAAVKCIALAFSIFEEPRSKQPKKLQPADLYSIIISNNMKTDPQHCQLAMTEKENKITLS